MNKHEFDQHMLQHHSNLYIQMEMNDHKKGVKNEELQTRFIRYVEVFSTTVASDYLQQLNAKGSYVRDINSFKLFYEDVPETLKLTDGFVDLMRVPLANVAKDVWASAAGRFSDRSLNYSIMLICLKDAYQKLEALCEMLTPSTVVKLAPMMTEVNVSKVFALLEQEAKVGLFMKAINKAQVGEFKILLHGCAYREVFAKDGIRGNVTQGMFQLIMNQVNMSNRWKDLIAQVGDAEQSLKVMVNNHPSQEAVSQHASISVQKNIYNDSPYPETWQIVDEIGA